MGMKLNDLEFALEYDTFTEEERMAVLDKLIDFHLSPRQINFFFLLLMIDFYQI